MAMVGTDAAPSVFQGHGILLIIGKSFYQAANSMTEIVGLSVVEVLEILGFLVVVILLWVFVQGMRGKGGFEIFKGDGNPPTDIVVTDTEHSPNCTCSKCLSAPPVIA